MVAYAAKAHLLSTHRAAQSPHPRSFVKKQTMKKLLLLTLFGWSNFHIAAQITVTSSTFPAVGDKLRYVQAANPNAAIGLYTPPGGNQYWDLSALTPALTFEVNYRPVTEGADSAYFPGATMVVLSGTDEYYYKSSTTKFELLGHADDAVGGLPLKAVYLNQPPVAERYAPLNFFDIYQNSSNNLILWKYSDIPPGAFNLAATPDSVRIRISNQAISTVDAYGTLRLPGELPQSEFPVLRLKKTAYHEQRIDAKIPPLGWLDVTDNVIQSGLAWAPLFGVDTIVTHNYYNDSSKEEIAVLRFNSAQNAVIKVVYKNTLPASSVVEIPGVTSSPLQVYPNPAVSAVTISCADAPSGQYTLKIFSSLGTVVKEGAYLLAENTAIQLVLPPEMNGLYFCRLEDAEGNMVGASRLVVMQ